MRVRTQRFVDASAGLPRPTRHWPLWSLTRLGAVQFRGKKGQAQGLPLPEHLVIGGARGQAQGLPLPEQALAGHVGRHKACPYRSTWLLAGHVGRHKACPYRSTWLLAGHVGRHKACPYRSAWLLAGHVGRHKACPYRSAWLLAGHVGRHKACPYGESTGPDGTWFGETLSTRHPSPMSALCRRGMLLEGGVAGGTPAQGRAEGPTAQSEEREERRETALPVPQR